MPPRRSKKTNPRRPRIDPTRLAEMIEEATVDCYIDSERITGDLPLPTPPPAGADWIEAYRRWLGGR